ncbi:MAG: nucleotidyltransferase domain-containing protein [Thermodesulfobacteriota bacterium]|nr:MAG: nucleotidyltransferase domain-containing protein [Thermodesulfobacteriota bacterium]
MIEEKIKEKVYKIFREANVGINRIILFGSRARGDWERGSDWDILIVVNKELTRNEKMTLSHLIRKELAEEYIPCDVIIKSEKEIEYYKNFFGTVTYEALKEGIEI